MQRLQRLPSPPSLRPGRITWELEPPRLSTDACCFTRQQAMKLTPFIYQPSWMGCLLLQHSKGVTEGESNRGQDGRVWEQWRGRGIKAGRRRRERIREVGGMNIKKGVGCCLVQRERTASCCQGVCQCFFYMHLCGTVR